MLALQAQHLLLERRVLDAARARGRLVERLAALAGDGWRAAVRCCGG